MPEHKMPNLRQREISQLELLPFRGTEFKSDNGFIERLFSEVSAEHLRKLERQDG